MTVIGTLIGERFRLEEKVGSGGMSSVYRAYDPTLERRVAIKMMHRDISSDPAQLERFRREARAVAQLNHPHVVTVIDAGEAVEMNPVREPLPDVQRRRPEISAPLAAVIERATAKETQHRYATVDEMVHDLEEVLAIEAARTGQATGEATTVLRTLSGDTADFAPQRLRHPKRALFLSIAILALVAGTIAYFATTRTEKGPGRAATPSAPGV